MGVISGDFSQKTVDFLQIHLVTLLNHLLILLRAQRPFEIMDSKKMSAAYINWQLKALGLPEIKNEAQAQVSNSQVMEMTTPGLIDSHCHIDFIFNRLWMEEKEPIKNFENFKLKFKEEFPKNFEGKF